MSNQAWEKIVPVIETARLIMRGHRMSDFPDFAAKMADPAVYQYVTGKALSEEDAWRKFIGFTGHWVMRGYGYWALEEKSSGDFLGEVGFGDFKRDMTPSIKGMPEIGWVLAAKAHGKGFATEAVAAALQWADKNLKTEKTCCIVEAENTASVRLAKKFGYQEAARTRYEGFNIVIYERMNPSASP